MTPWDRSRLLAKFKCNSPSDAAGVIQLETMRGFRLPDDYLSFLQQCNGGEGFVGDAYVILWRLEELREMNDAYEVAKHAPGLFLFGSDGGGEAFAFDVRLEAKPVVAVPFVGMELSLARPIAQSFEGFLEELSGS